MNLLTPSIGAIIWLALFIAVFALGLYLLYRFLTKKNVRFSSFYVVLIPIVTILFLGNKVFNDVYKNQII